MRSRSSLVAVAATLLLHLGLGAAIVFSLPDSPTTQHEPVKIALLVPVSDPHVPPAADASIAPATENRSNQRDTRPAARPKKTPRLFNAESPALADATAEMKQTPPATAAPPSSVQPPPHASTPATGGNHNPQPTSAPVRTAATDAAYASTNRRPPYPRISQSNEEQGTVVLRVLVKADGTSGSVEIKQTSGYPRLDEAARSTVQTWRFAPATVDGKPVAEWYQLAIPFTLQNN